MHIKLADELLAASRREGEAMTKRENVHKMADAKGILALRQQQIRLISLLDHFEQLSQTNRKADQILVGFFVALKSP